MRVLDTKTGHFAEIDPERTKYAILSHTWNKEGEQTYEQLRSIQRRYNSASQAPPNSLSNKHAPRSRTWNGDGSFRSLSPSQPQSDSTASSTLPTTAIRRLTRSEVDDLFRSVPPSQLPSDSVSMTLPTTVIGCLTQSEVDDLFRVFCQAYGLTAPAPPSTSIWDDPELSPKILHACRVARENGYHYIWIDSCCIDKSSSSELSEAINSMYKWYGLSAVCYAYLADVPPGEDHQDKHSAFCKSRWFMRGWTLQELIAPLWVEFLSKDWVPIGSKHALVNLVESVTKVDEKALLHLEPLDVFSVAQRLSWAANRETTRVEDRAYSLLGIFDINMSTLYGEGDRAFRRLQEQIMQRIPDHSLFAWGDIYLPESQEHLDPIATHGPVNLTVQTWSISPLGKSPANFQDLGNIRHVQPQASHRFEIVYTLTSYGIRAQFYMIPLTRDLLAQAIRDSEDVQLQFSETPNGSQWYLIILQCEHTKNPGHLLGRLCYVVPSESGVGFLHSGYIKWTSSHRYHSYSIFPLSPKIVKHYLSQTQLKTVYIPHLHLTTQQLGASSNLRRQPYTSIKLMLLRETRDALRSRGYSADLRDPDLDHPTMHWLTLSNNEHTISVKFQHSLWDGGKQFDIKAEVKMSGSHGQYDSAPDSGQGDCHTMSWRDSIDIWGWNTVLDPKRVEFYATGARTLIMRLRLDFVGCGCYLLHIDVVHCQCPTCIRQEKPS